MAKIRAQTLQKKIISISKRIPTLHRTSPMILGYVKSLLTEAYFILIKYYHCTNDILTNVIRHNFNQQNKNAWWTQRMTVKEPSYNWQDDNKHWKLIPS